jgi:hypothetical protein
MQGGERRVRFDGELIQREMIAGLGECQLKFFRPILGRLLRSGIDQIERVTLERLTRDGNGRESACTPSETRLTPALR